MLFLKVLMQKVLTRCKIVLWYRFRQNEDGKWLRCDFFGYAPSIIYRNKLCKVFSKKLCIKSSLVCDFLDWKHVRMIATCKKKTFSSRKFIKTILCYFWKMRSQSNDFYHPFRTFATKVRVSRLKSKFKSRNLYLPWFDFYKEWKSVRLEHLTSIY